MSKTKLFIFIVAIAVYNTSDAFAGVLAGRAREKGRTFNIRLLSGLVTKLDVTVKETRAAFDCNPADDCQEYLENYSFEDFGFNAPYMIWGLALEKQWKYVTLEFEGSYMKASANAVARRIYAINADVNYQGKDYDYMLIEKGQEFQTDLKSTFISLDAFITPFHIETVDFIYITPWLHAGIFALAGNYEIDAGEPKGITTYEAHPYEYVIGGQGEGWNGLAVPQFGAGGEVKFAVAESTNGLVTLALRGNYALLNFSGTSSDIGFSSRNEKNLDIDYNSLEGEIRLVFPVSKDNGLLLSLNYRNMKANGSAEAIDRSKETQEELKEKYDKDIEYNQSFLTLHVGLEF